MGDIESQPFLEAARQLRFELGSRKALLMHLTLVPYIATAGETRQNLLSTRERIAFHWDATRHLVIRSDHEVPRSARDKIALFTNVEPDAVIPLEDVPSIYAIPGVLADEGLDEIVVQKLG